MLPGKRVAVNLTGTRLTCMRRCEKRGLSLAGLSAANGYHATAAGKALRRPWPALEILIADALGIPPHAIWPSHYKYRVTVSVPENAVIKEN
jgi:lambda repressor-like predicted transcriptional regulator